MGAMGDAATAEPALLGVSHNGRFALLRILFKGIAHAHIYASSAPVTDILVKIYMIKRHGVNLLLILITKNQFRGQQKAEFYKTAIQSGFYYLSTGYLRKLNVPSSPFLMPKNASQFLSSCSG